MFDSIRNWLTRSYHRPSVPMSSPDVGEYLHSSNVSSSGEVVTVDSALSYSPVWQAVDLITSDVSRIPFLTYRRVNTPAGEGKERARTHPAYRLLRRYTGEMTANMWLVRMVGHALLFGNAYTRLRFSGNQLLGFEWLHSDRVTPRKIDGRRVYTVRPDPYDDHNRNKREERIQDNQMFHLEGLAINQLGGLSIVGYARNTIGRAMAAEGFGDDFYSNGGPSVIFTHPGQLSQKAQKNWLKQFTERHSGRGKRFRFGIIEEAMTASQIGVSAEDAMLIDSLKFSVRDVARYFNIPPHKLGDDSRTSFNSTEQENMSYFNSSLGKWTSRIEFEANEKLFTEQEREEDSHFAEFKVDALFKANTKDRMDAAAVAVTNGIKSRNEVRAEENLNPYEGGDEYLTPLNLTMGDDGESDEDNGDGVVPSRMAMAEVVFDAYERATTRMFNAVKPLTKRPEKFAAWMNSQGNKRAWVTDSLRVSFRACGCDAKELDQHVDAYMDVVWGKLMDISADDGELKSAKESVLDYCRATTKQLVNRELIHES